MLQLILRVNKNIIQEYREKIVKIVYKKIIHIALKYRGAVGQAKWQHLIFIRAVSCSEGSQIFGIGVHSNSVKRLADIEFGIDLRMAQTLQGLIN